MKVPIWVATNGTIVEGKVSRLPLTVMSSIIMAVGDDRRLESSDKGNCFLAFGLCDFQLRLVGMLIRALFEHWLQTPDKDSVLAKTIGKFINVQVRSFHITSKWILQQYLSIMHFSMLHELRT